MLRVLLTVRLAQLRRIIVEMGIFRFLVVLFLLFHLTTLVLSYRNNPQESLKILGLAVVSLGLLHSSRPDKGFFNVLKTPFWLICLTEYALLTLPLLMIWTVAGRWPLLAVLLLAVMVISAIPASVDYRLFCRGGRTFSLPPYISFRLFSRSVQVPFIPAYAFEWISGIRKYGWLLAVLYLAGCFFSGYFFAIPVAVFLFCLLTTGFYFECEPREFLEGYYRMAPQLVRRKCLVHLRIAGIILLPMIGLHGWLHPGYYYLLVYAIVAGSVLQLFSIVLKYALYAPGISLERNALLIGFSLLGFLFPYIAAVPVLMTLFYYRKAVRNVNSYFE